MPETEQQNGKQVRVNGGAFLAKIKAEIGFEERDKHLLISGFKGLVKHLRGGGVETYEDKLEQERKKGHKEAASYGLGRLGGTEFVLFATHWEFLAGTFGRVVGEKLVKAAELAEEKKTPLALFFSSAGARQHENFTALIQMSKMTSALARYKEKTSLPCIAILHKHVWGGISASAVPMADLTIALDGTKYGFAGPSVIESAQGTRPSEKAQTVQAAVVQRRLDLLAQEDELLPLLSEIFSFTNQKDRAKITAGQLAQLPLPGIIAESERFKFGKSSLNQIVYPILLQTQPQEDNEQDVIVLSRSKGKRDFKDLHERFRMHVEDHWRPDTDLILRLCFDTFIPLYNRSETFNSLVYPKIIAGLGRIGSQRFLVLGNQPSYYFNKTINKISKIPCVPAPEDIKYFNRMLKLGERLNLPAIFITDTIGAESSLPAEKADIARIISEAIEAGIKYKPPTISIITGLLGSGGGLVTTPIADRNAMLEFAMAFVAEPVSATTILYSEAAPDLEKVKSTIDGMRPTAQDQKDLKLIDDIIPEPGGGAQMNPFQATFALRRYIAETMVQLNNVSQSKRLKKRYKKIRNLSGIPFLQ